MRPDWWFYGVVFCANLVEAVAGFGSTVIALTIGANAYAITDMVPVLAPMNIVLSGLLVARHTQHVNRRVLFGAILPLVGLGAVVGAAVASRAEGKALKLAYGLLVMGLAASSLWRLLRPAPAALRPPPPAWRGWLWLLAGGVVQGIYLSGGPLVVIFASQQLKDKTEFRSTLSSLWLLVNIVMTGWYFSQGAVTAHTLKTSALLLVPVLLGLMVGERVHHRIHEATFRKGVFGLLFFSGSALVAGALR